MPVQPALPAQPWNVFVQGNVILGQDFSDQDVAHQNATTSSFQIGADYQLSPNFLFGAFFGYNHSDANLDENGSSATVDSYAPGLYASYAKGGWYGNFLASYSHNAYTEQRVINIGGTYNETANGSPEGDQETVNVDGGYDFHDKNKQWTYGPTLGLQYTHLSVDSFTESGGCSADLAVNSQAADSFRSRLGGHVSYTTNDHGLLLTPFLDASWQHEFLDGQRGITSSFDEISPETFTVYTPALGRESALLSTGVNFDLDNTSTVFTNYQVQVTPDAYFGQSVMAGMKVAF
jgi:outer membrane autotransporter protein